MLLSSQYIDLDSEEHIRMCSSHTETFTTGTLGGSP